ncbi:uncharacterized protein LOC124896826 [Capsicum annuum]|uniref:uncharacterized protein LOC124896826 n=1 Tax=Capsicum annuum TaxID=4072 RepID=UPI001FB0CB6D|nr:uncharacterized protein LOC124896826 [Capsicum annuum]
MCLLSSHNLAFAKLLAQIIRLRAQFPDYPIKVIRLNNAGEFTSQAFDDYSRPLLMKTKLSTTVWDHAILHAASLAFGSKDKNPRKRSTKNDKDGIIKDSPEETPNLINPDIPEEISEPKTQVNEKLLISSTNDEKTTLGFVILVVYVDDINLIVTLEEVQKAIEYLKKEFEMKDLGKTKLCLGLQIEHLANRIFIHQAAYTQKVLKRFYMDKAYPLSTPMVVRSLDVSKDPFRSLEEGEEILDPEVPYLSTIGALVYLANATRPDIAFSVNLLARYSSSPT